MLRIFPVSTAKFSFNVLFLTLQKKTQTLDPKKQKEPRMLISKLFTMEAILETTLKFDLYPLPSSLVQMLYLKENMATEKHHTILNS